MLCGDFTDIIITHDKEEFSILQNIYAIQKGNGMNLNDNGRYISAPFQRIISRQDEFNHKQWMAPG